MTREEAKKILEAYIACESKKAHFECSDDNCDDNCPLLYEMGTVGEHNEAINMAIQALEQTQWIPIEWKPFGKNGYPKPEDEYKYFLTIDDKGEITIQEFLLSLDEEPQPYFTGMRNIIAWMPLPEPWKGE